jgi:glycosyltransferase involved in cell wall biosynthesis
MTNSAPIKIGWKVSSLSGEIASVRYRALLPSIELSSRHYQSRIFAGAHPRQLKSLDVLIFVKATSSKDLGLAQLAKTQGIPVILDLCDNIFIETYKGKGIATPAEVFTAMARQATAIVVTTVALSEVIKERISDNTPIYVIPDGIETTQLAALGSQLLAAALQSEKISSTRDLLQDSRKFAFRYTGLFNSLKTISFRKLLRVFVKHSRRSRKLLYSHLKQCSRHCAKKLYFRYDSIRSAIIASRKKTSIGLTSPYFINSATSPAPPNENSPAVQRRILWFGNHGANHAKFGMLDLLEIKDDLERVAAELSIKLIVVSNNLEKYKNFILPLAIASEYIEWSAQVVEQQLKIADIVIIPNTLDAFSRCKSANRAVLALSRGTPVVATGSPALRELSACIELDDFYGGIMRYLNNPHHREEHLLHASKLIELLFGQASIGNQWEAVLTNAIQNRRLTVKSSIDLIVVLHLIQDLDLALPILREAQHQNLTFEVWCSLSLSQKSPRTIDALKKEGWDFRILSDDLDCLDQSIFPRQTGGLLSIVETNLGPHRFSRRIVEMANEAGIYTATMQHGFENVGLTYDDEIQSIIKISFASKRIYLWGGLDTLHKDVAPATQGKCLAVGCPKPAKPEQQALAGLGCNKNPIIGVFENLHWHRYSEAYRNFFIEGIKSLAATFPELTFLVKPHHAGVWLTSRYDGDVPVASNLIIADPLDKLWESFTAGSLLGHMNAVITTPSTVALDAARYGLPVAIVQHTLALENYAPIYPICEACDWTTFVQLALDRTSRETLISQANEFAARVTVAGRAEKHILDDMTSANKHKVGNLA